ncbi:MAG: hypothetical protein ABIQ58_07825 [Candidatus Limnocylindrales bacterium]
MDRWVRALMLAVLVLAAACGGGTIASPGAGLASGPSTAPAATARPPATLAPSIEITIQESAASYLALTTTVNASIQQANAQFDAAGVDAAMLGEAWAAYAAADEAYIAGLDSIAFPSSVAGAVRAMRDAMGARVQTETGLAADPMNQELLDRDGAQSDVVSAAARELRSVLGLPPSVSAATPTPAP